jgi:pimeloyl-ACP methyl ester carboxylesterase
MPHTEVNGVDIYYELHGEGEPLVLMHGSWADTTQWTFVVPSLAESFQALAYDRRGHSRSSRPDTQGSLDDDGDDLAGLLEALELAPAHVVTNSMGGNVALRLATRRPELFRSLTCHEPPLFALLQDDPESQALLAQGARSLGAVGQKIAAGDNEGAARQFVDEVAFGPGAWENEIPPEAKEMFIRNAPTFLDELQDPTQMEVDTDALGRLDLAVHLTQGSDSPPTFAPTIDRLEMLLPRVSRETLQGTAHVPHLTTPELWVESTTRAVERAAA